MKVCELDSGSATDCQPICDRPATHTVTYLLPCYGKITTTYCAEHAKHAEAYHYPYTTTVIKMY